MDGRGFAATLKTAARLMRVMVAGAAGQLGAAITREFSRDCDVRPLGRPALDITNEAAAVATVSDVRPDVIVNCAAFNDVDGAEDDAQSALAVNGFGVLALARAAASRGATLVHYSTDFVFAGTSREPYVEEDVPEPRSTYGLSKLIGEWFASEAPAHYVLRVESLFGGPRAKSSVDRILSALLEGKPAHVFEDRTVSPSYVTDVATATKRLLTRRAPFGLYHCVNTGFTTWLGLAEAAAGLLGKLDATLVGVKVADVRMRAERPQYCALSNRKLHDTGVPMPSWQDALRRYVELLVNKQTGRSLTFSDINPD